MSEANKAVKAIEGAASVAKRSVFEAWLFSGFRLPTMSEIFIAKEHGWTGFVIGINHEDDDTRGIGREDLDDDFKAIRKLSDYDSRIDHIVEFGMSVMIMPWVRLTHKYNEQLRRWVEPLLDRAIIMHDGERFAQKLIPDGYTHRRAVDEIWAPYWEDQRLTQIYTDYTLAPKDKTKNFLRHCGGGCPQAYPRASWRNKGQSIYTPGVIGERAEQHWGALLEPWQLLILGTAGYDLSGHPGTIARAVDEQWRPALEGREDGIAMWSLPSASKDALRRWNEVVRDYRETCREEQHGH